MIRCSRKRSELIARHRIRKQVLKAGIATEVEVNFLGNGMKLPVPAATNINKGTSVTTNRITEDSYLFDLVIYIQAAWQL
jgi:hypothetical protein